MLRRNPKKIRKKNLPTCHVCGLWERFCVCEFLPRLQSRAGILLVQHSSELLRQSNTGRLVEKMVSPSRIVSWGAENKPFDSAALEQQETNYLVLYPRSNSRILQPTDIKGPSGEKTSLVLLDATWAQAKSMSRRSPSSRASLFSACPRKKPRPGN